MRLIGDALWRAERDTARNRAARLVVKHGHVHPVTPGLGVGNPHARLFDGPARLQVTPAEPADFLVAVRHDHSRRRDGFHPRVRMRTLRVGRLAPAWRCTVADLPWAV